jgi:hypothetical protein
LSKSFLLLFSKKQAFLPLALPAAAYLGSYPGGMNSGLLPVR